MEHLWVDISVLDHQLNELEKKTITKSPVIAKILEKILFDKYCVIDLLCFQKNFQPEIYLVGN